MENLNYFPLLTLAIKPVSVLVYVLALMQYRNFYLRTLQSALKLFLLSSDNFAERQVLLPSTGYLLWSDFIFDC